MSFIKPSHRAAIRKAGNAALAATGQGVTLTGHAVTYAGCGIVRAGAYLSSLAVAKRASAAIAERLA